MQFVVQPPYAGSIVRYRIPLGVPQSLHRFIWQPRQVPFENSASGRLFNRAVISRRVTPADGHVHLNLWAMKENLAGDGETEVVVKSFRFTPEIP
jgi:hypothetical protein